MPKPVKSSAWVYSDVVKKHFFNPQNVLFEEDEEWLRDIDGEGEVGSPACGDVMRIWIKVDKQKDRIRDLRWQTFGCASAIGSTSMLSEMVLEKGGMKIEKALKLTPKDILKRLHGLPENKIHCSVLGDQALQAAIFDYFEKSGQKDRINASKNSGNEIVCGCFGVSKRELEMLVKSGYDAFEKVKAKSGAGGGCGECVPKIKTLIREIKKTAN
jgi:Fe-S cluster assembly protein NifU